MLNNMLMFLVVAIIVGTLFLSLAAWVVLFIRWFQGYPLIERKYHSDVIPISKFALFLTVVWLGVSVFGILSAVFLPEADADSVELEAPAVVMSEESEADSEPTEENELEDSTAIESGSEAGSAESDADGEEMSAEERAELDRLFDRISRGVQFMMISGSILILVLFASIFAETGDRVSLARLGFRLQEPWLQIMTGIIGVYVAIIPIYIVRLSAFPFLSEETMHPFLRLLKERGLGFESVLIGISAVIIAPILEELLFRVVLQSSIIRGLKSMGMDRYAAPVGIVLASIIFAAVHGFPDMLSIFPLSIVLGTIYHYRRSYLSAVTMHAFFNGMNFALTLIVSMLDLPVGLS